MSAPHNCDDCHSHLGKQFFGLMGPKKATPCTSCQKRLCSTCAGKHALIPFSENEEPPPVKKSSIKSYCKECFQKASILDYTKSYDVVEPSVDGAGNDTNNNMTLLFAHGGGSSRAMFRAHSRILSNKGYRCILIDLPGHGTLVDKTTLTLDECVTTVKRILQTENCNPFQTIYVGASLGAYIGFHILSQLKTQFAGAILMDCGQNVGPDCSLKARLGIFFMRKLSGRMTNKRLMEIMMGAVENSKADFHLVECCYASGMFFEQGVKQCDCLHTVAPADIIPELDFPILFFNGSEDYRDSEQKWLSLCTQEKRSELKVYEGGDHFFCHDSRFVDDFLDRMDKFAKTLVTDVSK